jgi:hypothetical protein
MIVFRQTDRRYPFLWTSPAQPPGRWHAEAEGPAHYFADTPDGAWAEFIRHEEITDPGDLGNVTRTLWAVEIDDGEAMAVTLDETVLTGAAETWPACQAHARELRKCGATRLSAPSAALLPGAAHGFTTRRGLEPAPDRDGLVLVDFNPDPGFVGWRCVARGGPPADVLPRVRHFRSR